MDEISFVQYSNFVYKMCQFHYKQKLQAQFFSTKFAQICRKMRPVHTFSQKIVLLAKFYERNFQVSSHFLINGKSYKISEE